jgi:peroxiredoxin
MTLKQEIEKMQQALLPQLPAEAVATFRTTTERLVRSRIADQALKQGDKAPNFNLPNSHGKHVDSQALLRKGALVVSFVRGDWCPYCDLELRALQRELPAIHALGAQLVAISPQTIEHSLTTREKRDLQFELLSDAGNKVARQFGLVFTLADELKALYPALGIDLAAFNGDRSAELPMPATYVIGTDGTLRFSFVNADYTQRAEPQDILAALRSR